MESKKKILIATGPTGGHFFTAVAFAKSFRAVFPSCQICFLLSREKGILDPISHLNGFDLQIIPLEPPPRFFSFAFLRFLFLLLSGFLLTFRFIQNYKPTVLVSFGSYASFPSVLAAWVQKIPIIVHEQNRVFGWANHWAGVFAAEVAISFPQTFGKVTQKKINYVGYPIRSDLRTRAAESKTKRTAYHPKLRILVMGGSQGSKVLNESFLEFLSQLSTEEKQKIAVTHITGKNQHDQIKQRYDAVNAECNLIAFSNQMDQLYDQADLVIGRAGAGTIFELAAFGLPSILVPYPRAYAHQSVNARSLEEIGAAVVVDEACLSADQLQREVMEFIKIPEKRKAMSSAVGKLDVPDAGRKLAALVGRYR